MIKGLPRFLFLTFSFLLSQSLIAQGEREQRTKELGVGLANFYYLGELNDKHFNEIDPGIMLSFRTNLSRRIGFNFTYSSGTIQGADSLSEIDYNYNRNLHFQSKIRELSAVFEINYFDYQLGNKKYPISPYLFFGVSVFQFNPRALSNNTGEFRDLQPIGTEGQQLEGGTPYKLFNFAIPFGVGVRFNVVGKLGITVFTSMRRTYTDYLDDVSTTYADPSGFSAEDREFVDRSRTSATDGNEGLQRGNSETKDWYNHTGVMLSFKIQKKRNMCPAWYAN